MKSPNETFTEEGFICCLCGKREKGWGDKKQFGNNPAPLKNEGECCDECNSIKVIPARIKQYEEANKIRRANEQK